MAKRGTGWTMRARGRRRGQGPWLPWAVLGLLIALILSYCTPDSGQRSDPDAVPAGEEGSAPVAPDVAMPDAAAPDDDAPDKAAPEAPAAQGGGESHSARFGLCHNGGGYHCVVDGDTFWLAGERIRIADIDTPETHSPRCPEEARLGDAATRRLHDLLNEGAFSLTMVDRDTDRYGRKLRVVTRGGESLGGVLVAEGLARWYQGGRRSWCD